MVFAVLVLACASSWAKKPFETLGDDITQKADESRGEQDIISFTNLKWKLDPSRTSYMPEQVNSFGKVIAGQQLYNTYCLYPDPDPQNSCVSKITIQWVQDWNKKSQYSESLHEMTVRVRVEYMRKNENNHYYKRSVKTVNSGYEFMTWRSSPEENQGCSYCLKALHAERVFKNGIIRFQYLEPAKVFDKREESFFEGLYTDLIFMVVPRKVYPEGA